MVKALIITWACLGLFTGCGGNSQKSKASGTVATLDPDLNLSIPDKNNQVDLSIPSISDQSPQEAPDLKLPDLLMVDRKGSDDLKGSDEIAADPVIVSANKKAPPSPVPWPKEVGPQGSGAAAPLTSEESAGQVKNRLDSLALSAEKKVEDAKVDPNDSWQKLVDVIAESGESQESQMGFYVSRSEFVPENKNEAHIANHISIVGGPRPDKTFGFSRVEASWEDWKITREGHLDGDLWMFLVSRDGNLAKFWRYNLVKKTNGSVIKHQGTDINQQMADKKWLDLKEMWIKKLVK